MAIDFTGIEIGSEYTRPELAQLWGYRSYEAISRGIVTSAGLPFVVLFITKEKQAFLPQYADDLSEDILIIEGEQGHSSDLRIVNADADENEIHLFYRAKHHLPFVYKGRVYLTDYSLNDDRPSGFRFAMGEEIASADKAILTEELTHEIKTSEYIVGPEGTARLALHIMYERNRRNRAQAVKIHGTSCKVCGFNFNNVYGSELAQDYIEVHHIKPLSEGKTHSIDPNTDLVPLCSNCHSMIHRKNGTLLTVQELKSVLNKL